MKNALHCMSAAHIMHAACNTGLCATLLQHTFWTLHILSCSSCCLSLLLLLSRIVHMHRPLTLQALQEQTQRIFPGNKFTMYFFDSEVTRISVMQSPHPCSAKRASPFVQLQGLRFLLHGACNIACYGQDWNTGASHEPYYLCS